METRPVPAPTLTPEEGHKLFVVQVEENARDVEVNENGDVFVPDHYKEELRDVRENWLECQVCGRLGIDEFEAHGVQDSWQEV